ncbi:hypothetical protein [Rhodospirillum sp. A1_3_36]|uniref:hypothetical protein n=1 Tax=Rhodospirillum sp. A1_3_36 TaxID=3391666 RepID=UPI0039A7188E
MRLTITNLLGPVMLVFALAAVGWARFAPQTHLAAVPLWLLSEGLAPVRLLPLIGLGGALALVGLPCRIGSGLLLVGGLIAGSHSSSALFHVLDALPGRSGGFPLLGPLSLLAAGLALLSPRATRPLLTLLAAAVLGGSMALAIQYLAPARALDWSASFGGLAAVWIIAAVALTVAAFHRPWFDIALRIIGSWLLAAGLLYGGASLVPKPEQPPLPPNLLPAPIPPVRDIP